ncbi:hypothetical protein Ddc_09012 [Ditylenchus destructor]|nr:hypothetical protein Ddc_09012 [Ditylenchus destructor]
MIIAPIVLTVLIVALTSAENGEEFTSFAFKTGLIIGRNFDALNSDLSPNQNEIENCFERINSQVEGQVQGVGFRYDAPILKQITDKSIRDQICTIYHDATLRSDLENCRQIDAQAKNSPSGILSLLKLVCESSNVVVDKNSECLSDIENRTHSKCVDACQRQAGLFHAPTETDTGGIIMDDRDNKMVCKVGACAVQCVGSQIQECDEDNSIPLKDFYLRLGGTQMLLGLESAHTFGNGLNAYGLLKSGKLPNKCQQMILRSTKSAAKYSPDGGEKLSDTKESSQNGDFTLA